MKGKGSQSQESTQSLMTGAPVGPGGHNRSVINTIRENIFGNIKNWQQRQPPPWQQPPPNVSSNVNLPDGNNYNNNQYNNGTPLVKPKKKVQPQPVFVGEAAAAPAVAGTLLLRTNDSEFAPHQLRLPKPLAGDASSSSSSTNLLSDQDKEQAFMANLPPDIRNSRAIMPVAALYTQDKEADDWLHNPDPMKRKGECNYLDEPRRFFPSSIDAHGCLNLTGLLLTIFVIVGLFLAYPIYQSVSSGSLLPGNEYDGLTAHAFSIPSLIDTDTPSDAKTVTSSDGTSFNLVFSDEFNTDGRTFWEGDDPYWEAVNLHYAATDDLEWYDPDQIYTENGKLVIKFMEMNADDNHNLDYRSGMLQSWNKFCFTGGYIEASISLPGSPSVSGFWPGFWMMGNLGRPGYQATTDGTWPYSYNSCDYGTLKNQTNTAGTEPSSIVEANDGDGMSYLPGQKLSSCTCSNEDHPGPKMSNGSYVGRSAPEIDVFEAAVDNKKGTLSCSVQIAPFDLDWDYDSSAFTLYNTTYSNNYGDSFINSYKGATFQESVSTIVYNDQTSYNGTNYQTFAVQYSPSDEDGTVLWSMAGVSTVKVTESAVPPRPSIDIGQRTISNEPMAIILNIGMSTSFATVSKDLEFPGYMYVDYVRVYQQEGKENIGCDPASYPTTDYINNHLNAYSNVNLTTWEQAGYSFPKNRLKDTC